MGTKDEQALNERLARTIRRYWAERGWTVDVTLAPICQYEGSLSTFQLRSNMVDGWPSGRAR